MNKKHIENAATFLNSFHGAGIDLLYVTQIA